jgi:hypothetical protein
LGKRKSRKEKDEEEMEIRRQEILRVQKENNVAYLVDSLNYNLSIQFEDIIEQKSKILIKSCDLHDVYKRNNSYYADISTFSPSFYFKLKITKDQKDYFLSKTKNNSYFNFVRAYLIIQLDSIKKLDLSYVSYEDLKIEVGETDSFTAKGTLIELLTKQQ